LSAKRVLLVDGDSDSRTVYRILLQHHGYDVVDTSSGEEGIRMALAGGLAAVVTELTLEHVDGHTLLTEIRADASMATLCVIVLTARVVPDERARAMRAGCTRFLAKPIEPRDLVAVLRELIGDP
jgi:two-component system cell cycle response regulator DivK